MPPWMTPEFDPVWWRATASSRSRTTTRSAGRRVSSSRAAASATMPAPTITRSASLNAADASRSGDDLDRQPDDPVVLVAVAVERDVVGLLVAGAVGGLGEQRDRAGRGRGPVQLPAQPRLVVVGA